MEDQPSTSVRGPVLAAVREQLSLHHGASGGQKVAAWSAEQWHEAFIFLFLPQCGSAGAGLDPHDDLLFFVHATNTGSTHAGGGGVGSSGAHAPHARRPPPPTGGLPPSLDAGMPFSVRRRTRGAPLAPEWALSGRNFGGVDWRASLLLNVVLQALYTLTTVACSQELLPYVSEGLSAASLPHGTSVTKRVYASPVSTSVNLERLGTRTGIGAQQPCYPDVCFAVENFDDAFNEVVLTNPGHCYSVILHALLPLAPAPGEATAAEAAAEAGCAPIAGSAAPRPNGGGAAAAGGGRGGAGARSVGSGFAPNGGGAAGGAAAGGAGEAAGAAGAAKAAGAAGAAAAAAAGEGGAGSSGGGSFEPARCRRLVLFSGYVGHTQIADFLTGHPSMRPATLLSSLLSGRQETRRQRIMMAGPGGMGQAEVAVQKLNGSGSSGGGSSSGGGNGGGGGGGFLRAAFGAVAAALRDDSPSASEDEATPWRQQQQQQGAAGGWELVDRQQAQPPGRGAAPRPADRLQCALMSMRLPVDKLARSVLECLAADARAQ